MAEELVVESAEVTSEMREALRRLWLAAFDGDFGDTDAQNAFGGVHVLLTEGEAVLAHASAVPRTILVGDRSFAAGYVEAVAVMPHLQGTRLGSRVMWTLAAELQPRWELGVLSTGEIEFYERLGWERWRGPSYVIAETGTLRTEDEDDGLMVLRFGSSAAIDLGHPISCYDRPGDAW